MKLSRTWIALSLLLAFLVTFVSLLGILQPELTYAHETENWALQAVGQDIGNLLAVLVLLGSLYFLRQAPRQAFFVWLGVLLYLVYAFLLYAFFVHFDNLFLVYVAILGLASYGIMGGLLEQNFTQLTRSLQGTTYKAASLVLIATGGLFAILWLLEIIPAMIADEIPESIALAGLRVNPVHAIDLSLVLPGMIITGLLLWQKKQIGYLFAAPWLTFSVLMGSSIVANMLLELQKGNTSIFPPLIIVSSIVIVSLLVLISYLQSGQRLEEEL